MDLRCKVCGRPVDPTKDIVFGAAGKPLFVAHATGCAPLVRNTMNSAGKLAFGVLERRAPEVLKLLRSARRLVEGNP
jgi:hypothetical protein